MADLDTDMAPRRRGRPKGTGIDDTELLRQILLLMANNKTLKPTTAIKQAGIDNPSIVRRLREKLKDPSLAPPPVAAQPVAKRPPPQSSVTKRSPAKRTATAPTTKVLRPRALPAAEPAAPRQSKPTTIEPQPASADITTDSQKARESALLAAYLKALQATAVPPLDEEQTALTPPVTEQSRNYRQPSQAAPQARPAPPEATPSAPPSPPWASNPFAAFQQPASPPMGMTLPFMPPFLQPFMSAPQPSNPAAQSQMEALKLSVEVMTAVTKLQMFAFQNTVANTPFGNMLQAQTMMGQMLLASFAGIMGGGKKPTGR